MLSTRIKYRRAGGRPSISIQAAWGEGRGMTALRKGGIKGHRCRGRIPDAGASGTITIAQFFFCEPSRYFLSRSSAAWLPTGSKAAFFERDTVTLPSAPTREKNLLNRLLPPGRGCTVQTASE